MDIVQFVESTLPKAIAYAEAEIASLAKRREANLNRAVERGTCAVGHDFSEGPGPHWDPIRKDLRCGYCESAIEHAAAASRARHPSSRSA